MRLVPNALPRQPDGGRRGRSVRVDGVARLAALLQLACAPSWGLDELEPAAARARCEATLAPHDVQGRGPQSPLAGDAADVGGVVTLAAPAADPPGFFLRSLAEDDDDATSEGLFVAWSGAPPQRGASVRVRGIVSEGAERTQLEQVERLDECGTVQLEAQPLDPGALPPDEPWESAWVRARAEWTVIDTSDVLRTGRLTVSPFGRVFASGHALGSGATPRSAVNASAASWALEVSEALAGAPTRGERARAAPRLGARLDELEGVVQLDGQQRRLLVPTPPPWPADVPPPPARAAPERVRLVALNLHDYFVDPGSLGARSELELARQRDKLVAALVALDADLLALTELGNGTATASGLDSLADLIAGLDARLDVEKRYAFDPTAAPGGDTLRAGIAYRPARLRARGKARFDLREGFRRPPLFQSFDSKSAPFTLGVVHFKSKRCGDTPVLVPEAGCGEALRVAEADLLVASVDALGTPTAEPVLVLGDFNADSLEAPLQVLEQRGFVDWLGALAAPDRYSFVFEGRASLLDHALAAPSHPAPRHEVAIWHINADEPAFRDYSLDNPPDEYSADPRRSSDHDPIVVDLALE